METLTVSSRALQVDFGKSADDYTKYWLGFPPEYMDRLAKHGIGTAGQRVIDLGTGTGLFAIEFARRGCVVTGLDPSADLLEKAKENASAANVPMKFVLGFAEDTSEPAGQYDVATAATAWHWFDRVKAGQEVLRLLRPGGRLVISVLEWHGLPGNVLDRTSQLIRQYRPANSISNSSVLRYPDWTTELVQAGYTDWDLSSYVTSITYSHDQWRGRVRASQAVGPSMDAETVQRFDNEMEKMLRQEFPTNPMAVPHRISTLIAWRRQPSDGWR